MPRDYTLSLSWWLQSKSPQLLSNIKTSVTTEGSAGHSRQVAISQTVDHSNFLLSLLFTLPVYATSSGLCICFQSSSRSHKLLQFENQSTRLRNSPPIRQQGQAKNASKESGQGREDPPRATRQQPQERDRMFSKHVRALRISTEHPLTKLPGRPRQRRKIDIFPSTHKMFSRQSSKFPICHH